MDGRSTSNANKRKIFYNYFSNIKEERPLELKIDEKEERESSNGNINTRNKPQLKHLSVDKYIRNKSCKNVSKPYWNEQTNKSLSGPDIKSKINVNLNLNLNVTGPDLKNQKKIEDFLNSNFCKLDDSKLSKIISKSPINHNNNSNILGLNNSSSLVINYIKNIKNFKKGKTFDNLCKTTQNKSPTFMDKKSLNKMHYSTNNIHSNTVSNSKYCSLNTSLINSKNKSNNLNMNSVNLKSQFYKNNSGIEEDGQNYNNNNNNNDEIKETSREKLKVLKEVLKMLKVKDSNEVNKEVENLVSLYSSNIFNNGIITNKSNSNNSNHSHSHSQSHNINNLQTGYNPYPSNSPSPTPNTNNQIRKEKENKILKIKIDEIDKKFEVIIRENKELKNMIKNKSEEFNKLHYEMNLFKKELKNLKSNNQNSFNPNNFNKRNLKIKTDNKYSVSTHENNLTTHANIITQNTHNTQNTHANTTHTPNHNKCKHFIHENNRTNVQGSNKKLTVANKKPLSRNLNIGVKTPVGGNKKFKLIKEKEFSIDYSRLDTMDLLSRAQVDDLKEVLYLPQKINSKTHMEGYNIPKLDITNAVHDLQEYDLLVEGQGMNYENNNQIICQGDDDKNYNNNNNSGVELDNYNNDDNFLESIQVTKEDKLNDAFVSDKDLKDLKINKDNSLNDSQFNTSLKKNFTLNTSELTNTAEEDFEMQNDNKWQGYNYIQDEDQDKIILSGQLTPNNKINKNFKPEKEKNKSSINKIKNLNCDTQNFFVNGTFDSNEWNVEKNLE